MKTGKPSWKVPFAKGLKEGRGSFSAATRGKAFWEEGMETGGGRVVGAEGRVQGEEEERSEGTGPEGGGGEAPGGCGFC